MDSFRAFARGEASRDRERMVFDWDKAATLIKEHGAMNAEAGLKDDWEYTGGSILRDGVPVPQDETYCYLASTWATPQLVLDTDMVFDCYRMESETPEWNYKTYWPDVALAILMS